MVKKNNCEWQPCYIIVLNDIYIFTEQEKNILTILMEVKVQIFNSRSFWSIPIGPSIHRDILTQCKRQQPDSYNVEWGENKNKNRE